MNCDAEDICKGCHACQVISQTSNPETIKSTELSRGPLQLLGADLLGLLPLGDL